MATFYGPRPVRVEIVNGKTVMVDYADPAEAMALKQALEQSQPEGINRDNFVPFTGDTTPNPE